MSWSRHSPHTVVDVPPPRRLRLPACPTERCKYAPPGADPVPLVSAPAAPLAQCVDRFWSPAMSRARLRAVQATPPAPPDLLMRSFEPPDVPVRGKDLATLLTPAYLRLAGQQPDQAPEE